MNITCPACNGGVPPQAIGVDGLARCPACSQTLEATIFPAALREEKKGALPEKALDAGDATCFFHHDNVAAAACDACGAYVCTLCHIPVGTMHYCPPCFSKRRRSSVLLPAATLHDQIALLASLVGILTCWLGWLFSPALFVYSIWSWNKLRTPYRRSRRWLMVAMLLALVSLGTAIFVLLAMVSGAGRA